MDFVRSNFGTNEPLPVEHFFFLTFWPVCCVCAANQPKSEEKGFNWQRLICTEFTSSKIHILARSRIFRLFMKRNSDAYIL